MISSGDNNNPDGAPQITPSDFSIDHILNRAGNNSNNNKNANGFLDGFSWLQCTRYCPPKVPRAQRREGVQKRQLGRHPRIPFTGQQLSVLEEKFKKSPYLSSEEVIILSQQLNLADVRVKIWFQNRRARERREKVSASSSAISASSPGSNDSDDSKDNESESGPSLMNFLPASTSAGSPYYRQSGENSLTSTPLPHYYLQELNQYTKSNNSDNNR